MREIRRSKTPNVQVVYAESEKNKVRYNYEINSRRMTKGVLDYLKRNIKDGFGRDSMQIGKDQDKK